MKLVIASDLDKDNRINCFIAGYVAYDPQTTAYLRRSAGRRRAGKPTRYSFGVMGKWGKVIEAWTDAEAVEKANQDGGPA